MPQDKKRVNIYNGDKYTYSQLIDTDQIDPNGIYFVDGDEHEIYVGTQLYGNGSSSSFNFTHVVVHCYGPILDDILYEKKIKNVTSQTGMTVLLGGVYLNGLRTVDEIQVGIAIESNDETGETYPVLSVITPHEYPDSFTELTIDLYISPSNDNRVSDTVIISTELTTSESE